jgi:hypothetical protein
MTALSVQVPFPVFYDRDGQPLDNGNIYIGESNLDPVTNPLQVYYDEALTLTASQPLKTSNGYIYRNGTPAQLYVNAVNFSILVNDSKNLLVYSFPEATGLSPNTSGITYNNEETGGVDRDLTDKLNDFANASDFGAVGNGATDDTDALTDFFNSAIANPGVPHKLNDGIYLVSDVLPDIDVSNVWIEGVGAEIHDTGELISGSVIKWVGTPGTNGPLVRISAASGAGNQRISSVNFTGIGIDCNEGDIDYGLEILSARFCNIDVAIANAGNTGLNLNVVATLGESKDLQRCNISLKSRQIEAPNGFGMVLGGDSSANVSMNTFWVDSQIANIQSIYCVNSDNNIWDYVRIYKIPSGTATEGVSLLGGATFNELARAEKFNFYTGNVNIHVYGTTGSPSFAFPSVGNSVFLDKENGTPNPTIETSGEIGVVYNTTQLPENAWVEYVPTVTPSGGAITSYNATGRYAKRGNIVTISINVVITNNGTGVGTLDVTLPFPCEGSALGGTCLNGRERAITGVGVTAYIEGGSSLAIVTTATSTYPGGNGHTISFSGSYEVA